MQMTEKVLKEFYDIMDYKEAILSACEAEYIFATSAACQIVWL